MRQYKAWPFQEARQIEKRRPSLEGRTVVFETGFGPSGLPHIGTFAEVARTTWVRHAYNHLTGAGTRLIAFSDDMDGLRKVPLNLPNGDMLAEHLGKPLNTVPDPFGCCDSYSGHMNAKLREFLDTYQFNYDFRSSSEAYRRGDFDAGLNVLLEKVEEVRELILPTLREEKRADWSPFFPVCPQCGSVYATRVTGYHSDEKTIDFACDGEMESSYSGCGEEGRLSILGGAVKAGWKVDWALRWFTYGVDYEMYGKDLIDSARLSSKIVRLMGKQPPAGLTYELFLDESGAKISKSVGKGLTVDAWVEYAPIESLLYFLFQNPKRAKRMFWGVVPKCVDEYIDALSRYADVPEEKCPDEDLWHVFRGGDVPTYPTKVNFSVVNNLISALATDDQMLLVEYLERYDPNIGDDATLAATLIEKGLNYYRDQVLPNKQFRPPTDEERSLFGQIRDQLSVTENGGESELQAIPFNVARESGVEPKDLFRAIYEVLLGQERGPRFGSFVLLLGKERVVEMLSEKAAAN